MNSLKRLLSSLLIVLFLSTWSYAATYSTIQLRRATAASWASTNPIPAQGEPCFETDTNKMKIGDGTTHYNSLVYLPPTATPGITYPYPYEVDALASYGGGTSFTQSTIEAALTAIGTTNKVTLLLRPGTWVISSNADWSAYTNVTFKIVPGAMISHGAFTVKMPNVNAGIYQIFDGTGAPTLTGIDHVYPEWWGALADNYTDNTTAMNIAVNLGIKVKLQVGTYLGNIIHSSGYVVIDGAGDEKTFLKSYAASGVAWSERVTDSVWTQHAKFNDLCFLGDSAGRNGIMFGDVAAYTANIENAGHCEFNNVQFLNTDIGVHKPFGNIGNTFNNCNWRGTYSYAYYAWEAEPGSYIQHVGFDKFNGGSIQSATKAGIAMIGLTGAGGTIINGTNIEGNSGFGIFVKGYPQSYTPLTLNDVWMENNATAGSVTIDSVSYTPQDYYFEDVNYAVINRSNIQKLQLVNSSVHETDCTYGSDTSTVDAASVRIIDNANTSYPSTLLGAIVNSIGNDDGAAHGTTGAVYRVPPRSTISYGNTAIVAESFSGAGPWAFTGTAAVNATTVADGMIYANCAEITLTTGQTEQLSAGTISYTSGRWYVYTIDVKLTTTAKPNSFFASGTSQFMADASTLLIKDRWVTIGGIQKAVATSSSVIPYIINSSGSDVTLRLSAMQVMEFLTKADAINYFNNRLYQP